MAWLQIHQTLKDHRKLFDAADKLEIQPAYMMGLLISFWMWALDNAPDGNLDGITPRMISRAAQWDGQAEKLIATLVQAGWLDEDADSGILKIHDWYEYTGKLIGRRQAEKERSKRRRASTDKNSKNDRQTTGGQPAVDHKKTCGRVEKSRVEKSIYNPPLTPQEGETVKKHSGDDRFSEFWSAYPKKVAKQYALKAWKRLKPNADLHQRILKAVEDQKQSEQWRKNNGQYIPNPATWLNGGQWDNEMEGTKNNAADQRNDQRSDTEYAEKDWIKGFVPATDVFT